MQDDKTMRIARKVSAGVFLFGIFSFLFFLGSCQNDKLQLEQEEANKGNVTLHINLPGIQGVPTYAASEIDENEVQTVNVLVFNVSDNKFLYHVAGSNISDGSNASQKTFNVKLQQTSDPSNIYLLVIANAKKQVEDAVTSGIISVDKKRDDVMRNLTFPSVGKWGVPPGPFTRFPMWGQSGAINTASTVTIDPISLVRAVAKIDVGLKFENNAFSGLGKVFKLEEIYLYNSLTGLLVCPDPNNLNSSLNNVGAPSVSSAATVNSAIQYMVNGLNDNPDRISYTNRIYTGEHSAGSDATRPTNLCLVIGGRFGSEAAEGTTPTYYRVDFIKTTRNSEGIITQQEYLPVLRNHFYRVNITKVCNRGYDTKEEAFSAMGLNTNLTFDISDDDGEIKDIVYDGQYMLGVSRSDYLFDKTACTGKELIVSTTYPAGWKATSDSPTWLTVQNTSSTTSGKSTLKFDLTANTTGQPRTGKITLQAGRLFKVITVVNVVSIVEGVSAFYIMDSSKTYSFNIKSTYAWSARVNLGNDPSNILQRGFTSSGAANISAGTPFSFKLENDILYQTIRDATVTVTFYSPTKEFESFDVPIRGVSIFDLGGLDVYGADLPTNTTTGQTWNQYRDACAAFPSSTGKPWRIPTDTELVTVYKATGGGTNVTKYNFVNAVYYWSSTPNGGGYYIRLFSDGTQNNGTPTYTGYFCRCVRTK